MIKASQKQKQFIKDIESMLHVRFSGISTEEAQAFIDRYSNAYHRKYREQMSAETYIEEDCR